jgi:cyclase
VSYERGPAEVADGVWAYLQPEGGWGWSNAGLVAAGGSGLLIDTLFDARLTAVMLEDLRRATPAAGAISTVVNTHANGDHWYGNSLVAGAEIVASRAAAAEMVELPPSRMADLLRVAPGMGEAGAFLARIFGPFHFDDVEVSLPTRTFDGQLDIDLADRRVSVLEVGPAHTRGDAIVHLPAERVVFTGDIVFHGGHPIVWAGPLRGWMDACQRILDLEPEVVVPGHGPLAGPGAVAAMRDYFAWLLAEVPARRDAGMTPLDAARDLAGGPYREWGEGERLVVNVMAAYRDLGSDVALDAASAMAAMAALAG